MVGEEQSHNCQKEQNRLESIRSIRIAPPQQTSPKAFVVTICIDAAEEAPAILLLYPSVVNVMIYEKKYCKNVTKRTCNNTV